MWFRYRLGAFLVVAVVACSDDDATLSSGDTEGDTEGPSAIHRFANGCFTVTTDGSALSLAGNGFAFTPGATATPFFFEAADLGQYLLYDPQAGYVVAEDGPLLRQTELQSDVTLNDDAYVSGAQWELQPRTTSPEAFVLRHVRTGRWMGSAGLVDDAAAAASLTLSPASGCLEHPELSVDAEGAVVPRTFDDGSVWGIVDTHSHLMSNFAFGGGGIFHGAAFHPLGVQHALPDCTASHGENGRHDFFGFAFDSSGADGTDIGGVLTDLIDGELSQDNHATAGYPEFTDWPNGPKRSTHQTQYWRWLERAYLGGLRLVVQHATTNAVICELMVGQGIQPARYSCDDMVAVDRIIRADYELERYIDAQAGGPGRGWFRIVFSPEEAREVIASGKLAVILGIETSDVFDCKLTPDPGVARCDADTVRQKLDQYYEAGIRVLFPVHKYDNAFSAGDGDRAFIELGNFFNSGHWSNFTLDCPNTPAVFDQGSVEFGGLNMPRDVYESPPAHDFSAFFANPLGTAFGFLSQLNEGALEGAYCQNAGLTPLGETLMMEMMARGMIIEIDHFSQRSYQRAFELLEANDYPASASHGTNYDGRLYRLGGVSKTGLGRCRDPQVPGSTLQRLLERVALIEGNGGYPAEGFGFDLNGFAGAPAARFAEGACDVPQSDPITYPFTSYGGDVTFTAPRVGNRVIDFNTEGLVHIGLLPELIEDARGDANSDADLEPLFRSAEGYIRMWEKAERRAREMQMP